MDSPLDIQRFHPLDIELLQAKLATVAAVQEDSIEDSFTSIPTCVRTSKSIPRASTPDILASSSHSISGTNTHGAPPSTPVFMAALDKSDCNSQVALDFIAAVVLAKQQAPFCYSGQFSASRSSSTSGTSTPDSIAYSEQESTSPSRAASRASTPDSIASSEQKSTSPSRAASPASTPDLIASSEQSSTSASTASYRVSSPNKTISYEQRSTSPSTDTYHVSNPNQITSYKQRSTSPSTANSSPTTPEPFALSSQITYRGAQAPDQKLQIAMLERQLAHCKVQWRQSILNASPRRLKKLIRTIQRENECNLAMKASEAELARKLRIVKRTQRKRQAGEFRLATDAELANEWISPAPDSPEHRGFGEKPNWEETAGLAEEPSWDSEQMEMDPC